MTNADTKKLHLIQPDAERLFRWLTSVTQVIVEIYWGILRVYGTIMLYCIATGLMIGGVNGLVRVPSLWYGSIPAIVIGFAIWVSRRFRMFIWACLGCAVLWAISIAMPLGWILGTDYRVLSVAAKIGLVALYAIPPLVGALIIDHARHKKG